MGFFGSGDKTQQAFDQRIGVSESGVLVQPGGFLFNPNRQAKNAQLAATATGAPLPDWVLPAGIVVAGLGLIWFLKSKL